MTSRKSSRFPDTDPAYVVAALAVATGIAPSVLMQETDEMLATMIEVVLAANESEG